MVVVVPRRCTAVVVAFVCSVAVDAVVVVEDGGRGGATCGGIAAGDAVLTLFDNDAKLFDVVEVTVE